MIWLNVWCVYNPSDHLCFLRSIEVAMFPDLSSYFCEYNVITADKNDDYTNRTYGVIKPESNFRYREFVGITGLF